MMQTQLLLRVEARDDEARLALENELRAKGLSLVVTPTDGDGNTSAVLEMPSDLAFLEPVTNYLINRIHINWSVTADSSLPVAVALHEALVNAIKHGNKNDPTSKCGSALTFQTMKQSLLSKTKAKVLTILRIR